MRHGDVIRHVTVALDGKTLSSWSSDGMACLWDIATGKEIRREFYGQRLLCNGRFAVDGSLLGVLGDLPHGKVLVWDMLQGGEPPGSAKSESGVMEIAVGDDHESFGQFAFSADGKLLAGATQGFSDRKRMVRVWKVQPGKELQQLEAVRSFERSQDTIQWLAFGADAKTVLCASSAKKTEATTVTVWELSSGKELRRFPVQNSSQQGMTRSVALSVDGRKLAVGTPRNQIVLYDTETGQEFLRLSGHKGSGVGCVAFSPDGKTLASGGRDNMVRLWDAATGRELHRCGGPKSWVETLAFTPDGKTVVSAGQDNIIRLWDVATGKEMRPFGGHEHWVMALAISPNGKTLATGSWFDNARLWDTTTGREVRQLPTDRLGTKALAFSPDGALLAAGQLNNLIRIWDAGTGKQLRSLVHHQGLASTITFSPDGKWLLSGSQDKIVRLWDVAAGQELRHFKGHEVAVSGVAFSPDGKLVASASTGQHQGDLNTALGRRNWQRNSTASWA